MERRFIDLCLRLGIHPDLVRQTWTRLVGHYSETHRHYHRLAHIAAMLEALDSVAAGDDTMELAIWFHDVIYDPKSHTNEEDSARCFQECFGNRLPLEITEHAFRLIMATKHSAPRTQRPDEDLIRDIDLIILAASPADYEAYRLAIRQEYEHVPLSDYIRGRGAVLSHFLQSPIFTTDPFTSLEDSARQNILAELRQLNVTEDD